MSYTRVLPRDLFNEAKLLKCVGQLALLIYDGLPWPIGLLHRTPPKGFVVHRYEGDGGLYVGNLDLVARVGAGRYRIALKSGLNSRGPYPLVFGDKKVPAGEYSLFIDVNSPSQWTLIVSNWGAMTKFDPNNKTALWGAYNYTADKDVARVPMKVETLPFAVDQLTWTFLDMTADGGRVALMWARTMASTPFKAVAQ